MTFFSLKRAALILSFTIFTIQAFASPLCIIELTSKQTTQELKLEVGTSIKVQFLRETLNAQPKIIDAFYLGRLVRIDNTISDHAFYDAKEDVIHFVREEEIEFQEGINLDTDARLIAKTLPQRNGTCAAYALFNCVRQLYISGIEGNGNLESDFSNEIGRLQALGQTVEKYYGDETHTDGIDQIATYYGLQTKELDNFTVNAFKQDILDNVKKSGTVLIRFNVPKTMAQTPYKMIDHYSEQQLPRKIWQPMTNEDEKLGGHMILISSAFTANGKTYLLVQDANWKTIRLWDLDVLDNLYSAQLRAWRIY